MTATDVSLMPLAMQLSRTRASMVDVRAVLGSVCSAVSAVMGVGGVVLLLTEPLDGCRTSASDDRAAWIGETQLRADSGPLPGALRTGRPLLTADITRIGPPALAAAAAECGLVSSFVVLFGVDGDLIGALQLLGEAHRPVEPADRDLLLPLLEVLATRLADVKDLRRARSARPGSDAVAPADAGESSTTEATTLALPAVHGPGPASHLGVPSAWIAPAPAAPSTTPRLFAPWPTLRRRPGRHSLDPRAQRQKQEED